MSKWFQKWSGTRYHILWLSRKTARSNYGYFRLLSSSTDGHVDVPVLIVGAGPVGLVLSMLLTKLEVKCAVIEKNTAFSRHPQAHFVNNRSMEIFRKLDGLAGDIQKLQPSLDLWRKFIYCTSLSGSVLGSVDHMKPQDFEKIVSPTSVAHFSQYKLVSLLLDKLKNMGFHVYNCEELEEFRSNLSLNKKILMGLECISVNQSDQSIKVGMTFLKRGRVEERTISCGILVGSDGARSTIRRLMGIEMKGERDLQNLVSVHFLSRNLGKYLSNERPGMLFFIFNPEAIGVLVAHDLDNGEFVLQIPFYPPQQSFKDFSTTVCENIIFKLVGWKLEDVEVVDIKPWVMHAEVAENFVACNNRVVLVGDAAHRFPPAGGFGMNTGIQDAHNLAWKIVCLLKNVTSPAIMETYETERKPIAISNTRLSVNNFKAAMSVPAALGIDPTVANTVHRLMNSSFGAILPSNLQKAVLEGIFSIGRSQLSDFILNESNPIGLSRLSRLRAIFAEGKSLQLQFPAEDLGFRYLEGALVAGSDSLKKVTEKFDSSKIRGPREYFPSAKPGSRLPHMNLRMLNGSTEEISTLDLVRIDKLEFVLIIAPSKDSYDLAKVAFKVAELFKVSLKTCVIWPHGSVQTNTCSSRMGLAPWNNFVDVEEVRGSKLESWWEMCQMSSRGVILVRPDDHIAWSTQIDLLPSFVPEVERVFSQILGVARTTGN